MSAAAPQGVAATPHNLEAEVLAPPSPTAAAARTLRVRAVDVGCRALLRVAGPVDAVTSPALGEALQRFRRGDQSLVLDLRPVDYIETPGLRLLMALNQDLQAGGGQMRLVVRRGSRVERTVRLIGLDRQCAVFHTVREAWSERPLPPPAPAGRAV